MKPISINIPNWQNLPLNPFVHEHTLWPTHLPALRQQGSHNAEREKCKEVDTIRYMNYIFYFGFNELL